MREQIHASAFAYLGAGCLLRGPSGSGKSTLCAQAILHGATLIGDDQLVLSLHQNQLVAKAAPATAGVLELRGLGLITVVHAPLPHPIHLVVEWVNEPHLPRLPEPQSTTLLGTTVPLLRLSMGQPAEVCSLLLYLRALHENRLLPTDWRPDA